MLFFSLQVKREKRDLVKNNNNDLQYRALRLMYRNEQDPLRDALHETKIVSLFRSSYIQSIM